MFALSTAWNARDTEDGHQIVDQAKKLGFDSIELHHSLKATTVKEILEEKKAGRIKISSLHNYCPAIQGLKIGKPSPEPYSLSSLDTRERRSAIKHSLNTIQFAQLFNAPVVILHCGWVDMENSAIVLAEMYRNGQQESPEYERLKAELLRKRGKKSSRYIERLFLSLELLIEEAAQKKVKLGIENRYFPSEIPSFDEIKLVLEKFEGSPLCYWHDAGHAQVIEELKFTPHVDYLEAYQEHMVGVHLHDSEGLSDHRVPLTGNFDFQKLKPFIKPDTLQVLEISSPASSDELAKGIAYIRDIFSSV